jgi:hypothetical protein
MRPRSCRKLANVRVYNYTLMGVFIVYHTPLADRVKRLKDARMEADGEIEAYRKAKDQEFSAFQSSVSSVRIASALTHLAYPLPACWVNTGCAVRYR